MQFCSYSESVYGLTVKQIASQLAELPAILDSLFTGTVNITSTQLNIGTEGEGWWEPQNDR